MAVALLATFYGAAVANLFCLPIADKLHLKLLDEEINRTLIIDGVLMIRDAKSPTLVREMLLAYLPEKHRHDEAEAGRGLTARHERVTGASDGARKKRGAHGGGHGWFVTFADLMGLLVALLRHAGRVLHQDQKKLQIVAGSMREAFGVQTACRYSGIIEVDGLPTRPRLKNVAPTSSPKMPPPTPSPDEKTATASSARRLDDDRTFALASASLRQALQDMPRDLRDLEAHHDRGDQAGPQHRDRRPGRPLDVSGGLARSPTSARAAWCSGSPRR